MDIQLIFNRIEFFLNKKKVPKMEFYKKIGMSNTGWAKAVRSNSIKISTLIKISEVLEIKLHELILENDALPNDPGNEKYQELITEHEKLKDKYIQCLEEKDRLKSVRGKVATGPELNHPEEEYRTKKRGSK